MFSVIEWKRGEILFFVGVVMAVAAVSGGQLVISRQKTRDAQRKADVSLVKHALLNLVSDSKSIPQSSPEGNIVFCQDLRGENCRWGEGGLVDLEGVVYLKRLPRDPLAGEGGRYVYRRIDEQKFRIYARMEYRGEKEIKAGLTEECGGGVECNWYEEYP